MYFCSSLFCRLKSESAVYPIDCEIVTPDRISELCPLLRTDDLVGGLWVPGDGVGNPYEICRALAALAAEMGVKVVQVRIIETCYTTTVTPPER